MSRRAATPEDLIGFRALVQLLQVSRTRAYAIYRDRSFPEPWYDRDGDRLWLRAEVVDWITRYRPGTLDDG